MTMHSATISLDDIAEEMRANGCPAYVEEAGGKAWISDRDGWVVVLAQGQRTAEAPVSFAVAYKGIPVVMAELTTPAEMPKLIAQVEW